MVKVLFLYASQTGNSRGIAKEMCDQAVEKGHDARVLGMEHWKTIEFEAEEPNVVVVASSTGNGDCPDNGDKFYRICKRKTTGQIFANTNFAVCAMGDSNYDAFCAVGKDFDRHFERLGGTRILKRCDVDEVEGIETFVEPWTEKLWSSLEALPTGGKPTGGGAEAEEGAAMSPAATPPVAETPSTATGLAKPAMPSDITDDDPIGGSADNPLFAPVTAAKWLTSDRSNGSDVSGAVDESEGQRRVLHMEIDVSAGGSTMDFLPGDAVGILPKNERTDVEEVMALLKVSSDGSTAPMPPMANPPAHLAKCTTVREALEAHVDLGTVTTWPSLPLLRLLIKGSADGTSTPLHERACAAVSTSDATAAKAAHAALQRERPTLASLLRGLQSTPDLASLLDILPPLAPRFYSIANAPAADPGKVHLCLSIVEYYTTTPDGTRITRRGLCSNMLAAICQPILSKTVGGDPVKVAIFKREPSGHELRLPKDPSLPVLMIGPGTGLAPFLGFIQHRRYALTRKQLGPCHLFFGCRAEKDDYLYADELNALGGAGAIKLHTAFSRSGEPCAAGYWRGARVNVPYVQDLIEGNAADVCELLLDKNGHVYVCGDGQSMARDVHAALATAMMMKTKVTAEEAEEKLQELAKEGKYTREIWN